MRSILRFLLAGSSVLILAAPSFAADDPAYKRAPSLAEGIEFARLWADGQRSYEEVPGMSIAIVNDQQLVWSGASGFADPQTKKLASAETLYSICSVSKLFTSVGVMQLRDEGKLNLDDPVSKHLPWFTMKPLDGGGEITVRGILTHSSGLPRESDFPYWTGEFNFPTREQIIGQISKQEALYTSGDVLQYSNLGITLAGEIVRQLSGKPYDTYVRERILDPLQMKTTYPEMPEAEKGKRLARGFTARRRDGSRAPVNFFAARGIAPAAGYASTVEDLAKFASWQFRTLAEKDTTILRSRTLREMQRANWVSPDLEQFWGLGFAVGKEEGRIFASHGGSCPGYRTEFLTIPAEKVAVIVMANASGVNTGRYAGKIYDIVQPTLKKSVPDPKIVEQDYAAYLGSYDSAPWWGEEAFFVWGNELASISLPSDDPLKEIEKYRKVGEHTFRRLRKDGSLGETLRFEIGSDGKATRYWQHSNPYSRLMAVR